MPRWVDCRRVTFKYGLGDEFIEVLKMLRKLGLDRKEPVRVAASKWRRATSSRPSLPDPATLGERMRGKTCAGHLVTGPGSDGGRGGRTSTTSSTTSGRCASTARRRSSGRPRSTPSSRWSCWRGGDVVGQRRPRAGGVPGPAVPREARGLRRTARDARARAVAPRRPGPRAMSCVDVATCLARISRWKAPPASANRMDASCLSSDRVLVSHVWDERGLVGTTTGTGNGFAALLWREFRARSIVDARDR